MDGNNLSYKEVTMKTLENKNTTQKEKHYGPDPLLYRKKGLASILDRDIHDYKNKIENENYMNYAIDRIAVELMHFIVK